MQGLARAVEIIARSGMSPAFGHFLGQAVAGMRVLTSHNHKGVTTCQPRSPAATRLGPRADRLHACHADHRRLSPPGDLRPGRHGARRHRADHRARARSPRRWPICAPCWRQTAWRWQNIVKTTAFLTDRGMLGAYRQARGAVFGDNAPASTLLFVAGLADPGWVVEIEAEAVA